MSFNNLYKHQYTIYKQQQKTFGNNRLISFYTLTVQDSFNRKQERSTPKYQKNFYTLGALPSLNTKSTVNAARPKNV